MLQHFRERKELSKNKTARNSVYKNLLVLAKPKLVACLLASDFPSENPRTQTRNYSYTQTIWAIIKLKEGLPKPKD
jgi:hypothetical protein